MNDKQRKAMYAKGFANVVKYAKGHNFKKSRLEVEFSEPDRFNGHKPQFTSLSFGDMDMVNDHHGLIKKHQGSNEIVKDYVVGGKPFPLERRVSAPLDFVKRAKSIGLHLNQFGWIDTKDKRNDKILDMYDQNYVLTRNKGELKKQ